MISKLSDTLEVHIMEGGKYDVNISNGVVITYLGSGLLLGVVISLLTQYTLHMQT